MRVCRNNTKMHSLRNDGRGSYLTTFFANPVVCSLEFKALQEFLQALLKITGSMMPAARGMMMFYDRVSFINELVIKKLQRRNSELASLPIRNPLSQMPINFR